MPMPACDAVTVQAPGLRINNFSAALITVQMLVVSDVKVMGRPELAVAVSVT